MKYIIFECSLGWVGVAGCEKGLSRVVLPQPSQQAVLDILRSLLPHAEADASFFGDLPFRMHQYCAGQRITFPDKLDFPTVSPFRAAVWGLTRAIPYGEILSYAWLARQAGNPLATRAVGQAMATNPWPIVVPCHRVIGSDGSLRGFGGGVEMKRLLLELEAHH